MKQLLMIKDLKCFYQILAAFVGWASICDLPDMTQMVPDDQQVRKLFLEFVTNKQIELQSKIEK